MPPTDDGRIEDGRIAIVASGGKAEEPLLTMRSNDGTDRQRRLFRHACLLTPGAYDAVLLDADGKELARAPFWMDGARRRAVGHASTSRTTPPASRSR